MVADSLAAYVFINFEQALGFGHVAWGFELEPGHFFYGSTDHLLRRPMWDVFALIRYASVAPGADIDYWSGEGGEAQMLADMSGGPHIRYHACKKLEVPVFSAKPLPARALAEKLRHGGWTLWNNNCVHQTYKILDEFGAGSLVARPAQAPLPVRFFSCANGTARKLGLSEAISGSCN